MPDRKFRVRVFVKNATPGEPGREDLSRNFNLQARHADLAAVAARARLEENSLEVVGLSHGPDNTIVVTVGREPRKGAPSVLISNPVREKAKQAASVRAVPVKKLPRRLGGVR